MKIDPFQNGISAFAANLRSGKTTIEQGVQYCLERIEQFDHKLQSFQVVDADRALEAASALDRLLLSGSDLGPLMGVPIGVKDIITVEGLPVTNGSLYPTAHLNGVEGSVVKKFRRLGCVILGKTKTVEFALGATGVNEARGTPWNPWDLQVHRLPGGSSSGSAVATAAGFCAFALGSDTGGSIRIPACYNGLFGHKTSMKLWPTDGAFPLSSTLDSIGPICRSAADAALIHECFVGGGPVGNRSLQGLRFARPSPVFFDELDATVRNCFDLAVRKLEQQGVEVIDIEIPESLERDQVFPVIVGPEIIATLTAKEFAQAAPGMDSVTRKRAAIGLDVSAENYLAATRRHQQLKQLAAATFDHIDAWISPTVPMVAMPVDDLSRPDRAQRALLSSRNTQLGNLYGLCAATLPIQHLQAEKGGLPVGFQLMMPSGADADLLSIAKTIEILLDPAPRPVL